MSNEEEKDFHRRIALEEAAKPLMKLLAENYNPHVKVIVESDSAEMVEGISCFRSSEFIKS